MQMQEHQNNDGDNANLRFAQAAPQKMPRKDKRRLVERFCTITVPENQNGKTKNLSFTCMCCGKKFMGQLLTAMIHVTGVSRGGQRVSACPAPPPDVQADVLALFAAEGAGTGAEDVAAPENVTGGNRKRKNAYGGERDRRIGNTPGTQEDGHPRALAANPFSPTDMAILRFFSEAGVHPDMVESVAFIEMVRALRNAPKNYVLPTVVAVPMQGGGDYAPMVHNGDGSGSGGADGVGAGHGGNGSVVEGGVYVHQPQQGTSSSIPVEDFAGQLLGDGQHPHQHEEHRLQQIHMQLQRDEEGSDGDDETSEGSRYTMEQLE